MNIATDIEIFDPRMRSLIVSGVRLERLHTGMLWVEGPVYFPAGDYLLWSDIPDNRIYQWVADLGVRVYCYDSNYSNGNTRDNAGRLISCQHLTRSVVVTEHDGRKSVLADQFGGKPLNSPNDVIASSNGAIWFTDPTYGIMTNYEGGRAESAQDVCGVYRIDNDAAGLTCITGALGQPNGLALSPDETTLYVSDSSFSHDEKNGKHHVVSIALSGAGTFGEPSPLFEIEHGVPDGFRIDEFGNIWCSSARGVEIYASDGTHLGVIHIPETVANLEFGGPKGNRLFITATSSVYAIYVGVSGVHFRN